MATTIIIVILASIFSAFFSGMEIAYISANRLKVELDKKQRKFSSGIVSRLMSRPTGYISTMLIGNNIAIVVYSIFMVEILNPFISHWPVNTGIIMLVQTVISTLIILIFAEFLPKALFIKNPNIFLRLLAIPVYFFYIILYPVAQFSIGLSNLFLRLFGIKPEKKQQQLSFTKIDIDYLVNEYSGSEDSEEEIQHELKIFQNALDFSKVKLRECMIPRTEIVALPIDTDIKMLKQTFIETGYSRILIYKDNIDNIIGYVHSSDMFKMPETLKDILLEISIVPETKSAKDLLAQLIKDHKSIAVVVDEFGGTAGVITVEDIIEEITGEIEDEYDITELTEKVISENEYIFSGRVEIDYLNEKYQLGIPESEDYETLAGFILTHHPNIPKSNEEIIVAPFTIRIIKVSQVKIDLVRLIKKKQ